MNLFEQTAAAFQRQAQTQAAWFEAWAGQSHALLGGLAQMQKLWGEHAAQAQARTAEWKDLVETWCQSQQQAECSAAYLADWQQRAILFLDTLRRRGNDFMAHEEAGCPPVLVFDYEIVLDGRELARPVNYALVRILPPPDMGIGHSKRPFIIIDPRAGHGSGIGGFKSDSEVGVILRAGHPVYFVIFFPQPEPGQTLADVCAAEAAFVRLVTERHPKARKPVIVGNCQGGWAAMLLGASHPDLTGPLVINGTPLSYWAGKNGRTPMRYLGGLFGGALPFLWLSDLGNGKFDGANLVLNFELLDPGHTWWRRAYDLFAKVDDEAERYLEFERWWGGFYFLNEAEIRWIAENLFIGNKLSRGDAELHARQYLDLRNVRSPIIVFASHGDNITTPQQALNWIPDLYRSTQEIKLRGQRIVYALHDEVGHLGIFVSGRVVQKEHREIVTTLRTVEDLPPGLYEMTIRSDETPDDDSPYNVLFEEREIADILALDDGRGDEQIFAPVARLSETLTDIYDLFLRPAVRSLVTPLSAEVLVRLHPLRQARYLLSDGNPALASLADAADRARGERRPAAPDNPLSGLERLAAGAIEQQIDLLRDLRDVGYEALFHALYGMPFLRAIGERATPETVVRDEELRDHAEVQALLARIDQGGFADAVIRMLVLIAQARGSVRRSRLERAVEIFAAREPFQTIDPGRRHRIFHEQSLIVDFEPEKALAALPRLVPTAVERAEAIALIEEIVGPIAEMNAATYGLFAELRKILGMGGRELPPAAE